MEELNDYTEHREESNFDIKAEAYKYLAYWKWLLLGALLGLVIAFLYNRYTIPEYRSASSMRIVDEEEKQVMSATPSGGGSLLALNDKDLNNQIETLRSNSLVESVVAELGHNVSYFVEGNVITVEAYENSPVEIEFISPESEVQEISKDFLVTPTSETEFRLEEESSGYSQVHEIGEIINLNGLEFIIVPGTGGEEGTFRRTSTVNIKITPTRQVAYYYIAILEIAKKGSAEDILSLSVVQESGRKSEDFLNKLMERFNEEGVRDKQEVAENTTAFIQERLELITAELDSVEGGMAQFKRENRIMDVTSGASEFRSRSAQAEQEIFNLETQLALIESIRNVLNNQGPYELLPSDIGISEGGISGLINSYNTLVLERNAYLRNSTPANPVVQTISDQLDSLRENLQDNIASAIRSVNVRLDELQQREMRAEGQFSSFPGLERGIRGIERQQQIKEQLYLFLLQRREEAAISFAATASVARVIDPAFTSSKPVDPQPWLILLGGFVIGLLIPLIVIFVKNMLDTKVHHKGDLDKVVRKIPFIGEIPRIQDGQKELIQENDRSPLAESFRILRTNLAYLIQNKSREKGEIIFVTSTIQGEGKTFVSYNLARTLATTKKKVLLIGADIRNPKLHRYSSKEEKTKIGLSDYLYDYEVTPEDVISRTEEENVQVDLLMSGSIPPNPAELFMSDRMENLLNGMAQKYDFVIVDTAPTMIVTDTLLISPLADTTLYVTRADFTEKKLLDFPLDLKEQGKLKGLAIVLNDVDYSRFSYGAKYSYSYGYGYGYGVEEEPWWKRLNPLKKS